MGRLKQVPGALEEVDGYGLSGLRMFPNFKALTNPETLVVLKQIVPDCVKTKFPNFKALTNPETLNPKS